MTQSRSRPRLTFGSAALTKSHLQSGDLANFAPGVDIYIASNFSLVLTRAEIGA
jgi:hypothetical protein